MAKETHVKQNKRKPHNELENRGAQAQLGHLTGCLIWDRKGLEGFEGRDVPTAQEGEH